MIILLATVKLFSLLTNWNQLHQGDYKKVSFRYLLAKDSHLFYDEWDGTELVKSCRLNPRHYLNLPPAKVLRQELWNEEGLIEKVEPWEQCKLNSTYLAKSIPCSRIKNSNIILWKVYKVSKDYSHRKQLPWISREKIYATAYGQPVFL